MLGRYPLFVLVAVVVVGDPAQAEVVVEVVVLDGRTIYPSLQEILILS
jgi:hypothetical protein